MFPHKNRQLEKSCKNPYPIYHCIKPIEFNSISFAEVYKEGALPSVVNFIKAINFIICINTIASHVYIFTT
jgi:hypothetical protein